MGRPPGPNAGTVERAQRMAALYRAGKTLQEIGEQFDVTREAVRQLLRRYSDTTAKDGGQSVISAKNKARRDARRDARCIAVYGCTFAEYVAIRDMKKPTRAFATQRTNARRRGIGWELTLWQWWNIWQRSGHWHERGLRRGQYVMCRYGDEGPYSINNVFIALSADNIRAANSRPGRDLPVGVYMRPANIYRPYVAKLRIDGRNRHLGAFATPEEAHLACLHAREAA